MITTFCGCLNVKIGIKGDQLAQLPPLDNLELTESQDDFFQQSPRQVELDSAGVVIQHDFFIQKRSVGRWNVWHCVCCNMDTHAVPHLPGFPNNLPVLANPTLVTNLQQVAALLQNERFSPVFKVILPILGTSGPSSPRIFPEKGTQMDLTVAAIQQLMSNFLKKEEEQVKDKIQRYTEQQQATLLDLETRVRQDRNTVLMLLAQKETQVEKKLQSLSLAKEATPPTTPIKRGTFSFQSPTKEKISARRRTVDIPDDDILFEFDSEYLDHNASTSDPFDASEFDYEDSSRDEGISIPRRSQPQTMSNHDSALAKSLPMRVPTLSNYRTQDIDIEDVKTPQNAAEMAASIKALARSVHGDSDSFWDLPRPRLNTLH